MDNRMVRSSGLDLFKASEFLRGKLATVDNRPNSTHVFESNIGKF